MDLKYHVIESSAISGNEERIQFLNVNQAQLSSQAFKEYTTPQYDQ